MARATRRAGGGVCAPTHDEAAAAAPAAVNEACKKPLQFNA